MHTTTNQSGLTAKELEYLSDSMKNEELLTKLCIQGAGEVQDAQLRQTLTQMAQERLQVFGHLLNTLQQQTTLTH
ncbi:hypothetical protein SD70_30335 [Gordoniibacillus kamchatkensis]|uniref:Spore coat protein n=1 Tax=Gordoniibacillus kamchatkensis TaxID=1590651 RepID=A0ABR5AA39_9BACL|nr:hypothetical protein [Paenibacillus sp. VKM B-2647]KIL37835.1 hypothetical protein SD70_30335 [Paenibacillus sp. VKM B-2647]